MLRYTGGRGVSVVGKEKRRRLFSGTYLVCGYQTVRMCSLEDHGLSRMQTVVTTAVLRV